MGNFLTVNETIDDDLTLDSCSNSLRKINWTCVRKLFVSPWIFHFIIFHPWFDKKNTSDLTLAYIFKQIAQIQKVCSFIHDWDRIACINLSSYMSSFKTCYMTNMTWNRREMRKVESVQGIWERGVTHSLTDMFNILRAMGYLSTGWPKNPSIASYHMDQKVPLHVNQVLVEERERKKKGSP